jgi:hypothetical protein
MRAVLIQNKFVEALKGEAQMPTSLSAAEKTQMNDKALSVIILCLRDRVLREIATNTIDASFWAKLDSLYMTKSLTHKKLMK